MTNSKSWRLNFFTFWIAQAVSLFGSELASFALVWWMTEKTGSASVLAAASAAALVPGVIFGPLAGALVDRWERKWVLVASDAASALVALGLAALFWSGEIRVWHIYLANVVRATARSFQFPAVQASTSLMAPKEHLARISGLNQALGGLTMIAAPPLGALLLALIPIQAIMGIDVLTALIAVGLLVVIRIPQPRLEAPAEMQAAAASVWQDMRAGFAFLRRWPALVKVMAIAALLNLVFTPAFSLVPILVTDHFGGSVAELGWINAAFGLGIVAGGTLLGVWGGFKRRIWTSLLGIAGLGVGSLLIGTSPPGGFWIAVGGMALVGVMNSFANGPFFAILQSIVPPEMQGRVFTVLMSISMAMSPLGLALAGPLADRIGVRVWYLIGALVCLGMVIWMLLTPAVMGLEDQELEVVGGAGG